MEYVETVVSGRCSPKLKCNKVKVGSLCKQEHVLSRFVSCLLLCARLSGCANHFAAGKILAPPN